MFISNPDQLRWTNDRAQFFLVTPGDALRGEVGLVNEFPDAKQVLLLLLLNYMQSDFAVDGGELRPDYRISLEPSQEFHITVRTRNLDVGYYDLIWVFVIDPENLQTDTRSRARTQFTPIDRSSVYVGDASPPTPRLTTFSNFIPDPSLGYSSLFSLEAEADSFSLWSDTNATSDTSLDFFLRFGVEKSQRISEGDEVPMALVGFVDYRQVKLSGEDVVFGLAKSGNLTTVPLRIQSPHTPGLHQFFVHRFPYPYTQVPRDSVPFRSMSSQRLVIHVAP
ncbi:MAG: hypothetical protein M1132_13685 [Chloroflexi bacterium]|nr:hypothetical protein [Chloroflexota bacterium]